MRAHLVALLMAAAPIVDAAPSLHETAKAACAGEIPTDWRPGSSEPIKGRGDLKVGERTHYETKVGKIILSRFGPGGRFAGIRLQTHNANGSAHRLLRLDRDCRIRLARELVYADDGKVSEILTLDAGLQAVLRRDALNPEVPDIGPSDRNGPLVALIDSGVNYRLPPINEALARSAAGRILGYDFWDMDERPFDAQIKGDPFMPRRHGTRTASIIIDEAPNARLVPYRYPEPDMSRMADLIRDAADKNIRIVAMPLGSKRLARWQAFETAARQHPEILFISSAGNEGIDIDASPVFPAALALDNLLVVTSINENPRPAWMSNWGKQSVDLMLPAERLVTTDFNGLNRKVSGSSYAVARLAALAARLLEENPVLKGATLKQAILDRSEPLADSRHVAHGVLPDPLADQSRVHPGVREKRFKAETMGMELVGHTLIFALENSGWRDASLDSLIPKAQALFRQCGIAMDMSLRFVSVSDDLLDFGILKSHTLTTKLPTQRPAVFLVRNSLRSDPYEGEAFGRRNTPTRPWLRDTVWLIREQRHPGITMAHELIHVLSDNGDHVDTPGNIMNAETADENLLLTPEQCALMRATGLEKGLLSTIPAS